MSAKNCLRCKAKVEAYALKCHVCGFQFPTHKRENIEEVKYSYKFGKVEISNEITEVIKINVKDTFVRCAKSFCVYKYKIFKIPKLKLDIETCSGCGNKFEKVSKKQAEQYLKNKNSILSKVQISKLEKLGKTTKRIKDQVSMENAGKVFGSLVSPKKRKKQLNEMSKEELINEVAETKFKSLSTKQLIGGCIGIFGYIIVKAIGGWGWHYGDIIGLFLLAFLPGALFIGGMLEDW
tara:strand:+ start:557 stop:1264 length:708 start_codon:yes stop_codon:yes gene_type:complete